MILFEMRKIELSLLYLLEINKIFLNHHDMCASNAAERYESARFSSSEPSSVASFKQKIMFLY